MPISGTVSSSPFAPDPSVLARLHSPSSPLSTAPESLPDSPLPPNLSSRVERGGDDGSGGNFTNPDNPPLLAPGGNNGGSHVMGGMGEYNPYVAGGSDGNLNRETVEDRMAAWRRQQQAKHESQTLEEAASAVDEQGRFKLFTTASRFSISIFFFVLMWRTVHHYELADATFTGLPRVVVAGPLVFLFLGEMMGAILGLMGGPGGEGSSGASGGGHTSHATKKRLKGVLNLHKFVELSMLVYNVLQLALLPSKYTPREIYIGRTVSNFFFLVQAQLYTKLSWDDVAQPKSEDTFSSGEAYYDDYDYYSSQTTAGNADNYPPPSSFGVQNQNQQQPPYQQQHFDR